MGILNDLKNTVVAKNEQRQEIARNQAECMKDTSISINITFGNAELRVPNICVLRQKQDGTTYFNFNRDDTFRIISYEWDGPEYDQVMNSRTNGSMSSNSVNKGIGAAGMVGPVIVGGGKSKSRGYQINNSATQQINSNVEKNGTAILKLLRDSDGTEHAINIVCNTDIDYKIRCLKIESVGTQSALTENAVESLKGIKALKELLDMGAITQEEFDAKKEKLLNI